MKTKITPINYIDDLEKIRQEEKCDVVGIDSMSITYTQPADSCSSSDEIQHLTITTQMVESVGDGEEGFYFNVTIPEGEHWSVDDGDSLKALVEDFKKRLYMVTDSRDNKAIKK